MRVTNDFTVHAKIYRHEDTTTNYHLLLLQRPNVHLQNTDAIGDIIEYLEREFQGYNILFVGDVNFPGIDCHKER